MLDKCEVRFKKPDKIVVVLEYSLKYKNAGGNECFTGETRPLFGKLNLVIELSCHRTYI